jgi:hypothetical protein
VFVKEDITGRALLHLTSEDMATIGVRLYGERMDLGILIRELKAEWRVFNGYSGGARSGVGVAPPFGFGVEGGVRNMVPGSVPVRMESGKGAPDTDAPPSYSQVL